MTDIAKERNMLAHTVSKSVLKLPPLNSVVSSDKEFHVDIGGGQDVAIFFTHAGRSENLTVNVKFRLTTVHPAIVISFFDANLRFLDRTMHGTCGWNWDMYANIGPSYHNPNFPSCEQDYDDSSTSSSEHHFYGIRDGKPGFQNEVNTAVVVLPEDVPLMMVVESIVSPFIRNPPKMALEEVIADYKDEKVCKYFETLMEKPVPVLFAEKMLANPEETFSDCEFFIERDETVVKAHKSILSLRSPVFEAMLRNKMVESLSGRIIVKDISKEIFQLFLKYIYLGSHTAFQYCEMDNCKIADIIDLLRLADFYQQEMLVFICVRCLLDHLTSTNVGKILQAAFSIKETRFVRELINECTALMVTFTQEKHEKLVNIGARCFLTEFANKVEEFAKKIDEKEEQEKGKEEKGESERKEGDSGDSAEE